MKTFGERIGELRRGRGLTQEQLGETIGVSAQTISKWENSNTAPDISLLPVLAEVFETSIDGLFGRGELRPDIPFDEYPEICYNALIRTYAECWCSSPEDHTEPESMIRAIRDNVEANSGVAADSGASALVWQDFACVSRAVSEEVLPLLDEESLNDFFAALARPSFRKVMQIVIGEKENNGEQFKPVSFTAAFLARKCGLTPEETEREIETLLRYPFVQLVETTVDAGGETPLKVYSRWGSGLARLFLFPLLLISNRFLTRRNFWRGFRG